MNILVTGGAGYIGSHTVRELLKRGHRVVILDNLSAGHRTAIPNNVEFFNGDIDNHYLVRYILAQGIDAVMHFAASSLVGESMVNPGKYFRNNVAGTLNVLEAMVETGVKKIVFSSSAAVYGEPVLCPILEDNARAPTNVYGLSKLMIEQMLEAFDRSHELKYVSLRYFNAAGADSSGEIGEDHNPETHLVPIVLQAAANQRDRVTIYGNDYPTPDGTCVRDYVHVTDLARAHVLALEFLEAEKRSETYNLGNGQGFSVKEVINVAYKITGLPFIMDIAGRRSGDPAVLVASADKIKKALGWQPEYTDLEAIIRSAWNWHRQKRIKK